MIGGLGKRAWNSAFSSGMGKRKWNSGFSGFQKGSLTDKSKSEFEESHIVSDKKNLKIVWRNIENFKLRKNEKKSNLNFP